MAAKHLRFAVLLLAAPLYADNGPALISDLTAREHDSALVRAAKNAVASRQRMAAHSPVIIDNAYLRRSHVTLTTSSSSAALPTPGPSYIQPQSITNAPPALSPTDRAALQQKIQQLNMERARMAEQADQPYAGDISEDRVDQRLSQIPMEINQAQRQLQTPAAPPTPRPPQE
jgi:hypothetical protein